MAAHPRRHARDDPATGLRVRPAPNGDLFRVFQASYGPANPLIRTGDPAADWERFDVTDHVAVYAASEERAAFMEALGPLRWDQGAFASDLGEMLGTDAAAALDSVRDEWAQICAMRLDELSASWRLRRRVARLSVRFADGWYVDVDHHATIATLRSGLTALVAAHDLPDVDLSDLHDRNRVFTCQVATWVAVQVLDDGSRPLGLT